VTKRDESRLTIGQRILTAMPNLERKKPDPPLPDEVVEQDDVDSSSSTSSSGASSSSTSSSTTAARSRGEVSRKPSPAARGSKKPDPTADMSNEELTHAIKYLDDRERRYALYAGPLGAAIGIALTIAAIHLNPPLHHKNHVAESTIIIEGFVRPVLGALVVVAALTRRRSFVGFALLFLGTADSFPYALLFWALGGWMIWRVFRYQRVLTSRGAGPQRGRTTQGPRAAARTGTTDARERAQGRREARERKRGKQPAITGPPPSKRYTPPKPTRPKPPAPT
jgi:hypothetical protein